MAEGLGNAVQIAIYNALVNTPTESLIADFVSQEYYLSTVAKAGASEFINTVVVSVSDNVTQAADSGNDSHFPYIVIGDDTINDWSTDTASGASIGVTIHTWSRSDGKKQTKQIQAAIYRALHRQTLTVPDHEFIGCDFENETSVLDTDMHTFHGTSDFTVIIDEVGYGD